MGNTHRSLDPGICGPYYKVQIRSHTIPFSPFCLKENFHQTRLTFYWMEILRFEASAISHQRHLIERKARACDSNLPAFRDFLHWQYAPFLQSLVHGIIEYLHFCINVFYMIWVGFGLCFCFERMACHLEEKSKLKYYPGTLPKDQ